MGSYGWTLIQWEEEIRAHMCRWHHVWGHGVGGERTVICTPRREAARGISPAPPWSQPSGSLCPLGQ